MAKEKLSIFPIAPDLSDVDYVIGVRDNGDGTFTNYKYTPEQIAAYVGSAGASTKRIVVADSGDSLTDIFFSNAINAILTNNQTYLLDVDYTQDTGTETITGTTISFFETQVLIALT